MQELIAFARGMANFAHNRGTKKNQERLMRDQLSARHKFLGAFDDSGNFAFVTLRNSRELQADVLAALNLDYKVEGVVIINRAQAAEALAVLETIAKARYGDKFHARDYTVWKDGKRWRPGLVFMDQEARLDSASKDLHRVHDRHMEVLSVQGGIIGVLKFDPKKPRIPWGQPAGIVTRAVAGGTSRVVATGRSARMVRGVLSVFSEESNARRRSRHFA